MSSQRPSTLSVPSRFRHPHEYAPFLAFLAVNSSAAVFAPIQDCDEVFNYWEPTHFISHGFGLQTWEYSPEFAIRSWLYIMIHAAIGSTLRPLKWVFALQIHEFVWIRLALGFVCALCQLRLSRAVSKSVGPRVATLMALVMLSSTGMFSASVAYLPSSFSMYTTMMGLASFLDTQEEPNTSKGIIWFGIGAVVGWPFSAALILPLLMDEVAYINATPSLRGAVLRMIGGVARVLPLIPLDIAVNAFCFRKLVLSPWRIVSYNIFSGASRGPDIFGTEPWHFYVRNLLLNFNIWFLAALCAGPLLAVQMVLRRSSATRLPSLRTLTFIAPFYLWLAIFSLQPHKEERFMYPAYPFLCFNAAITLHEALYYLGHAASTTAIGRVPSIFKIAAVATAFVLFLGMGILRTVGTITAYRAPLEIYKPLQSHEYQNLQASVCIGKEWYRFPSSYFLPKEMRAHFVKSNFDGLLPGQFSEEQGLFGIPTTWIPPTGMNDQNLEDSSKHVSITYCDFLVDSHFNHRVASSLEPDYTLNVDTWEQIACANFLDATTTSALGRIFWIPESTLIPPRLRRQWGKHCLLKRKATT